MAASFNLTAQLNLRGPSNIRNIVSNIRRQLGSINGNINFTINPATTRNVAQLNSALQGLNTTFAQTITSARNAANAIAAFGNAANAANINNVATNLNNVGTATNNASQAITRAARQTTVARTEMEEFGRQSALAVRRFAAFSVSTGAIVGLVKATREGISAYIDYDKQLVKLQQITGETAKGLSRLSGTITSLSTGLGVASSELISVSSTLAQAGLSAKDTERALKALALSSLAPSFDNLNKTVEGSIALMKQFGIAAKDLEPSLGSINAVAAKFAVESGDIIAAIQRTGGVFAAASKGVSEGKDALNEFISVFTSVRATTRESAETIATGLRTIFTRIQRGSTVEALKQFGVTLTDAEGKFVGAYKAVELLSQGLNKIDPRDLKFSQIVEELGGFRQIGKVIPLIQQFATAQQALAVAQAGAGSLAENAVTAQLSLANQISKVREEFLGLFREIGSSDSFQTIARGALDVASALIKVADSVKGVLPVLGIMLAMRGASAITQFGAGFLGGIRRGGGAAGLGGRVAGFASGGLVPGSGNRDSVPAMLTPGEFVVNKRATQKIGVGGLVSLNKNGGTITKRLNNGGRISDLPGSLIQSSVRETQFTFDKPRGQKFNLSGPEPTKFNKKDSYKINVIDRPVDINKLSKNTKEYTRTSTKAKYGASKKIRQEAAVQRGYDFENILEQNFGARKESKGTDRFSRLDGVTNTGEVFEARSRKEYTDSKTIAQKMVSGALTGRSQSEKIVSNRLTNNYLDNKPNQVDLGNVILFRDVTSGLGGQPPQKRFNGGFIQKFMRGKTVKASQTPKIPTPQELVMGPGDKKTGWPAILQDIINKNGLLYDASSRAVVVDNQKIALKDAFSARQLSSKSFRDSVGASNVTKLSNLRTGVVEAYLGQRSGIKEAARSRTPEEVASARSQKLLFGVAGMYGAPFPATLLELGQADGLKGPVSTTVFGSVLNKDKIEKEAKIARIQEINKKRKAMGKSPIVDEAGLIDRMSAPTAKSLSAKFGAKQAISGVSKANKQLAIDTVTAIAKTIDPSSGGSKIFLDFDKTLSFGSDKIGPKIDKKKPDYGAFSIPSQVASGLEKAQLSNLGAKLISIVTGLDSQSPGLGGELLRKMFVVSARPQKTMPLIARWLRNKGLRIPPSNVLGVGGSGLSANAIGINKAEKMVQLGAGPGSVFIDDDPKNIKAASKAGITSIQYGAKIDKKTKREAAQSEGLAYQDYIRKNLPANIFKAMQAEGESIDFPMGLGTRIATGWFNDPRLANTPVDTKRTLSGPRGKIKKNIVNYLKARGFADGGMIQKFMAGQFVMPKGRGKTGAKGARGPAGFKPLNEAEYQRWASPIYDRYYQDASLAWSSYMGIPMPPEIADYSKKVRKYVFESGGAGLAVGKDAKGIEIIARFGKEKAKKAASEGKLKKTELGLFMSAAGLGRGPRATEEAKKASYDKFNQAANIKPKFIAWGQGQGVFSSVVSGLEGQIRSSLSGVQLDHFNKILQAGSLSEYIKPMEQGGLYGGKMGHIPPLKKAIYRIAGITEKNAGGFIQKFATGGLADAAPQMKGLMRGLYGNRNQAKQQEQTKKSKQFGKIALRAGNRIQATYVQDGSSARSGQVVADKIGANLFAVQSSGATKGYGPKLYDVVMEAATLQGSMLTSDRRTVSPSAKAVWDYYFSQRGDVAKIPLDPINWTSNSRLVDPKLYGQPETWPPKNDPAWVLQTGYKKAPVDINNPNLVQKLSKGGSSENTVPAMVSNGEAFVPPALAKRIGRSKLDRMNQADRNGAKGFAGGGISVFDGPGSGTSDSIGPIGLPVGSYVIREKATKALGLSKGGGVGDVKKLAAGGFTSSLGAGVGKSLGSRGIAMIDAAASKAAPAFNKLLTTVDSFGASLLSSDPKVVAAQLKAFARALEKGKTDIEAMDDVILAGNTSARSGKNLTDADRATKRDARETAKIRGTQRDEAARLVGRETRQAGSVTADRPLTMLKGFGGQDMVDKTGRATKLTADGKIEKSYLEKASKIASQRIEQLGYSAEANQKALSVFSVTLRRTGDAQTALQAATTAAATAAQQESMKRTRERSRTLSTFGSFGTGRLDAAKSWQQMSSRAAAAKAPTSASSFAALAGRDNAGLGDALGVLGNKIKNLNLSALQKFGTAMATVNTKLAQASQTIISLKGSVNGAGSSLKQFVQTARMNPFKAITQAGSGISGILKKMTSAVSTATSAITGFGRRAAATPGGGGGDGGGGGGGRFDKLRNAAFGLSFAIPMITDMMKTADPKNAQQAASNAKMSGISTAVGSATMLASMGPLGMIAAIPTAVGGIIKAFADAENAAHEFNKQAQATKLEESLEKAGKALDNYSSSVKDVAAEEKARAAVIKASQEARTLSTMQQQPNATMVGMIADYFGAVPKDNMDMQRSQILEQKGLLTYLQTLSGGRESASVEFRSLIPQLAKENAKTFQGASEASVRFLETQFKSGKTVEDMSASGELNEFGRSLALADVKVQEYIMAVDNTVGLSDAQKNAMKENVIATQTEAKAREIQTRALREQALESLNRQTTQLQNSLERMFQNMEQALNASAYSLTKLSDSAELTSASLSGAARAGTVRIDAINALNNPRGVPARERNAAVTQAASMFGSQAPEMEGVLRLSGILEDTLMATINNTIKAANASGTEVTQEAIGAKLENSINQALSDLKLPPELATGLSREVKDAVQKMRKSGADDDKLDFSEIINQVPQLGKVLESSRRAQEVANKALEYWQQNLNEYANAMNNLVDTQVDINNRLRRSTDILISSQMNLSKALGQSTSLQASTAIIDQRRAAQTGGITDPGAIAFNIRNLEALRSTQEAQAQDAAQKGFSGKDEFKNMQNNLANTNLALRENYAALKDMAENTDKANNAMEKISEIRAKTQAGVGIAERLVTSSPQELASLNRSMALLNNNMRGGMNVGSTAEDRKGVLDVFNMIAPFLGDRQDALKANVLESMLRESGLGVNNMMQGVLDSLRNPAGDPQMNEAIRIYNQGVAEQVKANQALANLASIMNQNNAEIAAKKLSEAIQSVELKFETQLLSEINAGITNLVQIANQKPPGNVAGLARGGVVYAAEGQHINFKSKGTDTVPAMLTPGEFVVNRSATKQNLPLLQSINNGYQKGGKVSYYRDGGLVFGGNWGLDKNMNAQSRINAGPELESKEKIGGLNWNELFDLTLTNLRLKPIPKNNRVGITGGFMGFAGGDSPRDLFKDFLIKDGDRGSLGSLSLFPGLFGYDKLTLQSYNKSARDTSRTLDISPRTIGADTILDILDVPDLNFVQKVLSTPISQSFPKSAQELLLDHIEQIYSGIPDIKNDNNSFTIKNKKIIKQISQSTRSMTPTYTVSKNTSGMKVVVENLGKNQYSDEHILLDDRQILDDARKDIHKNKMGTGISVGVGVSDGLFGGKRLNASIGNGSALKGKGLAFTGLFGQNLWSSVYDPLTTPINFDIFSSMTGMNAASKIEQLIDFKARLKEAFETVNKASFIESSASAGRKIMINKMRNLVRGSSFLETFDPSEIANGLTGEKGVPTTLFNLPEDIWSKLFPKFNSPQGTYATQKNSWVPIGSMDAFGRYSSLNKLFPWVREGFAREDLDSIMNRKKEFVDIVGDLVKITDREYKTPNAFFTYKEIFGPAWDKTKGTFTTDKYKFNIIDNFAGDMNPFKGLQLDNNTEAILGGTRGKPADIDAFMRQMSDSYDANGVFNPFVALKLPKTDQALRADYSDNTKANAFYNLLSRQEQFEPIEYKKFENQQIEQERIAQREGMLQQAVGLNQQANNFDAGKRVALARLIFKQARALKVPIRGRMPEDIDQIAPLSEFLQQVAQNAPSDYTRTLAAGTKALFDNLSNINEDGSFFLNNGITINNAFNPNDALRKKIRLPDGRFIDAIYDYKKININENKLKELIKSTGLQRRLGFGQVQGAAQGNTGGLLNEEMANRDKFGLTLQGVKVMEADPKTGALKEKPFNKTAQELGWKDLFDLSFNPYAEFPDNNARQSLLNKFKEKFNTAVIPGTRRPAFDKKLLAFMNDNLKLLSQWYSAQDFFINTSDNQDKINQNKTKLQNQGEAKVDGFRNKTQPANQFYTNNRFGELPTYKWMIARLDQKINPADAQVQNAVPKATGGLIYASNGTLVNFQPRGTDTVPAMLTPGEFVVNREATKKHLPLLKNINMATGGVVQYKRAGGTAYDPGTGTFSRSESVVDQILNKVESGNKINTSTYSSTNKNLSISKNTNNLATSIKDDSSKLKSAVKQATGFAAGGMIYASNGALINFQPKGTDTVPAMLTPGEFVVNRGATQKHLSLLNAINNNNFSQDSVLTMNRGGYIQPSYLSRGGFGTASLAGLPDILSKITGGIQTAIEKAITQAFNNIQLPSSKDSGVSNSREIARNIGSFSNTLNTLADRLESISIPPEITIEGKQNININANGLQVLSSLNPSLQKIALNMIKSAIDSLATKNPGTLDFNIDYPRGQ